MLAAIDAARVKARAPVAELTGTLPGAEHMLFYARREELKAELRSMTRVQDLIIEAHALGALLGHQDPQATTRLLFETPSSVAIQAKAADLREQLLGDIG